ncbi:MAG: restriction endonuclease subunit S [Cyanobacteria bacterium MAG CAR4_bin_6]|nr:restriction endonuclease subunit S [Cyanobacteria bacterium MAG CAR4_bin_6]
MQQVTAKAWPYPAYKDSGVDWLGEVPEHWRIQRVKYLLEECDTRSSDGNEELLRVSQYTGVTLRNLTCNGDESNLSQASLVGYKCVEPNDLVINIMLAWNGSMGISQFHGITSPAYCVYRFNMNSHPWYFHYLLRSLVYKARIKAISTGIVESRLRLYTDDLYRLEALVPPLPEQAAIAHFLDHATQRIQRHIQAKQKLIKLLEEQKQVIIHQAVTGQINVQTGQPYPVYKDSGVEWLERVPEHWEVLSLKRWVSTKITDGPHETPDFLSAGVPFLSAEAVCEVGLDFGRQRGFISQKVHEMYCRKCRPQRDDIFMCKSGATTGKVAIVETDDEFSIWSPLALIRVDPRRVMPKLLLRVLQSRYLQGQVRDTWSYGTQPNLSMYAMERLVIALPSLDEQRAILEWLDSLLLGLYKASELARREINLLHEYRTRLIADVVTGKLDVREAAARLP